MVSAALNTAPCIPSRSRQPAAGAVLAAAHGDEPGSAIHPCVPRLGLHLTHWGSPCTSATPRNAHGRPSMGRPHRRRIVLRRAPAGADHAADAVAFIMRAPSSKRPRGVLGLPGRAQAPNTGEPHRRQGRVPPPPP
jgi:hypothetical protein